MIDRLQQQLVLHEGLRLMPYYCTAGALTIGVGRNLDAKGIRSHEVRDVFGGVKPDLSKGITKAQAMSLLRNDIEDAGNDAKFLVQNLDALPLQIQFVLIDMAFNMGRSTLGKFHTTLSLFKQRKFSEASEQMLKSRWAKQVGTRAFRLSAMTRYMKFHDEVTWDMIESVKTGKPLASVVVVERDAPRIEPVRIPIPEYIPNESLSQRILRHIFRLFK